MNKETIASFLNHYLSLATIIGVAVLVVFIGYSAYMSYSKKNSVIIDTLSKYILPLGFLVTFFGMFLTLFYSEVLHYAPCDLCWYQRVFLYPQVFIFAYAWYKKDISILPYTLILSILGFVIATYHHLLQMGYDVYKPCSTALFAVDCAKPSFIEFGFVTFPFMAVVLFGFLGLLSFTVLKFRK